MAFTKEVSRTIKILFIYLVISILSLSIINSPYTQGILILLGILLGLIPFWKRNYKITKTLYYFLIAAITTLIIFYPTIINEFMTKSSNIEVYISKINRGTNPKLDMSYLFQNDNYQMYLFSNYATRDIYIVNRTDIYGKKIILGSTSSIYDCIDCTYYIISVRNSGDAIISDFAIQGELPTLNFDFLDFEPKLKHSDESQKGTFGKGRFLLNIITIEPNETIHGTIRVNKLSDELSLKCFSKNRKVNCGITKYYILYLKLFTYGSLSFGREHPEINVEFPNKDGEEVKQYILNKKDLQFIEISSELYQEKIGIKT